MERIQAFPVGHIDFKLRKMYIEVLQGGLYELRTPRKKLKLLPQSALDEIDSYVDYIFFQVCLGGKLNVRFPEERLWVS
ncbi:hypothetical protein [Fibrobacter intestinalis]|nr:hypothetical protein [Fibrobacter sp. NR9]